MSGGYFNHKQYQIEEIITQLGEYLSEENDIPKDIEEDIESLIELLKISLIIINRVDWLASGDYSIETYRERLKEELKSIKFVVTRLMGIIQEY